MDTPMGCFLLRKVVVYRIKINAHVGADAHIGP